MEFQLNFCLFVENFSQRRYFSIEEYSDEEYS
jgi:hypothetical protein